jgi:hypothetical protein
VSAVAAVKLRPSGGARAEAVAQLLDAERDEQGEQGDRDGRDDERRDGTDVRVPGHAGERHGGGAAGEHDEV